MPYGVRRARRPARRRVLEQLVQPQMARQQRFVRRQALIGQLPGADADEGGRDVPVVEQRGLGGEPLGAHQFLVVEVTLLVGVHRVPMAGDRADLAVIGHRRPPGR